MKVEIRPLTRSDFAAYGDVLETAGTTHYPINEGTAERFHDLARVDVESGGGRVLINIFIGQKQPRPIIIKMMERHPLGTQCFMPLREQSYLVVVADGETAPEPGSLRAFLVRGTQGVNYYRNVWHHPLLVLEADSPFLVIDRGGEGINLEEAYFPEPAVLDW
ncbi:MAG TPA: ureidoglycolate lyase [Aestuariivirgaceae bacterium]|nr:ureidoglycolate lyase [Aestuariivirgaceae bacterium]